MPGFGISLGPIVFLYIAEIVEPQFISIPTTVNFFTSGLISILFPILVEQFGGPGPIFAFFTVYSFVSLILNQILLIETKDKTQTEIYRKFDKFSC